jgi:hypothetical protein
MLSSIESPTKLKKKSSKNRRSVIIPVNQTSSEGRSIESSTILLEAVDVNVKRVALAYSNAIIQEKDIRSKKRSRHSYSSSGKDDRSSRNSMKYAKNQSHLTDIIVQV